MRINNQFLFILIILLLTACGGSMQGSAGIAGDSTGQGGSMARFTIVDDMLYAISGSHIQLVNIADPAQPSLWNRVSVGFGIETLFAHDSYLFVGSETGVFIYDNSTPEFPHYVSEFNHVRSCDPVVVQGNYAFVTLRSNAWCWGSVNQLDILDISDIFNPVLEKTYPMQEPYGLGISDNKLFVCDGRAGLKVFNVEDKSMIQPIETLSTIHCYDVIPYNDILLVSADAGIFQYKYNGELLEELSSISANIPVAL